MIEIEVERDYGKALARFTPERCARAQLVLVDRVAEDSQRYVPVMTGDLYRSMKKGPDYVTWGMPYASHVYGGPVVSRSNKYGTDPHARWFEHAAQLHMTQWLAAVLGVFE